MLKDIAGIKISGALFTSPTAFKIFDPVEGNNRLKTPKGALLYGKNGSGKSTIARGFRKIAGENLPSISQAGFFDNDGNPVTLSEAEKKRIFVFDEDYVDKNVKLQEDHLDTIVMLGEQADLTEKIKAAEADRDTAKEAYDKQKAIYEEYDRPESVKSPVHYISKLRAALQGDDSWAGRDREIHDRKQNTGVRDDTYKRFQEITPSKARSELITDFEKAKKELASAKTGASSINPEVPSLPEKYVTYDVCEIQRLLSEKIEKPELSEREQYLLKLAQQGKAQSLLGRIEVFQREDTTSCPYCLQNVTSGYKTNLVQSIKKVLSQTVENHQKILREKIWGDIFVDLLPYVELEGYAACIELIRQIDTAVRSNNDLVQQKIDDPYTPIEVELPSIQDSVQHLTAALSALEKQRVEYNQQIRQTAPIISRLNQINSEIAHYDIVDLAVQYDEQCKERASAKGLYDKLEGVYLEKERIVKSLEAQRQNITLALDSINSCMKYIFFAEDRLRIEYNDGVYKLLSHGHSVKPCDVSLGERNIIGLCYFFTNILEGQEEKDAYNKEYVIIIDDPVSSYDMENRIGILSFLKYKLSVFLEGNINTKGFVMTHDLMTFYDVHKIFEEIVESCSHRGYAKPPKFNRFELRDEAIDTFQYRNRQEYTELVKTIYAYGKNQADDQSLVIGNIMRHTLEAFSTFEYKKGIENVSTDAEILSSLKDTAYETYFKNLMYRLVLHGGSHKEEQVKSMKDLNFFSLISDAEKRRTARDVLCFIYLLNKPHLISHLKAHDNDAEATLDLWCQNIKTRSVVI